MRCIKVCESVQGLGIWDLPNRATHTAEGTRGRAPIGKTDCVACGQCITHCPTGALRERDDTETVFAAIADPDKLVLAQIAPAVRSAWGEELGIPREEATVERLACALRRVGFGYVFDTAFSADLTIMEEVSELLERLGKAAKDEGDSRGWPMFTSCCPGWVRFVKARYPEFVDGLSTSKSPQQMFGAIAKTYYAKVLGVELERLFVVSVMPCTAKKAECALPSMVGEDGTPDVDVALTVREMVRMIRASHVSVDTLVEEPLDTPLGFGTGAGVIFGATGGVMEAAVRSAYYLVTGKNPDADFFTDVRGLDGWKEARAWISSAHQRWAALLLGAPTGRFINSCVSTVLAACAPPFRMFIMGTGRRLPFTPPRKRYRGISREAAAARQAAMETARMAFAPRLDLSLVPSARSMAASMA